MKFLKNILIGLVALLATSALHAATLNVSVPASTNNLSTGIGVSIFKVTLANPAATNVIVTLWDAPGITNGYTSSTYVTRTEAVGLITNTYVSITGFTNTLVYSGLVSTLVTNTGAATNYRLLATYVVPANSTSVYTPVTPEQSFLGLLVTNYGSVNLTVDMAAHR